MRHSRSKNEPCLRVANKPPEHLSAAQILVTLGLGKLLNRMGRKKGFKVSFFPDSLCISKKKLSTRHTSLSSLSMRVFRPAWEKDPCPQQAAPLMWKLLPLPQNPNSWQHVGKCDVCHPAPPPPFPSVNSRIHAAPQPRAPQRTEPRPLPTTEKSFKLGTGDVCQASGRPVP